MENFCTSRLISSLKSFRRSTPTQPGSFRIAVIAVFILLFSGFSFSCLTAQSNPIEPGSEVITTDAYTKEDWKDPASYASVIVTEKNNNDIKLSEPGLSGEQFALYTGYKKLLDYMQIDLSSKSNLEAIASTNYQKIIVESQTDPILLKMRITDFNGKFNSLVGFLLK